MPRARHGTITEPDVFSISSFVDSGAIAACTTGDWTDLNLPLGELSAREDVCCSVVASALNVAAMGAARRSTGEVDVQPACRTQPMG